MGRSRYPVSLLVYKGKKNLTKKEIEERQSQEVKAKTDNIKPPKYLPTKLKKEFKELASELLDIGIMSNLDVDALARFLLAKKLYLDVTEELMARNPVTTVEDPETEESVEVSSGLYSDLLINQDKLFKQCRTAASDLGLTISSRCKLVVPKNEDKKEPTEFEKKFGNV
ncbi:phage terminase small subunit P27 family [Bacillus sp. FJAT-49705]|uniref:Phage terminase small subunit P27 family n=1 Tax=Cytobacillus citreus TaxID=2833586 RepID=A0ABS5NVA6_9BACI|nr:phage terminase small subunit P27 family [Cytobacillus citreus]MBS4191754.1 phage terminase small subunit P27 family [Cytobacillus citreus]